MFSGKFLRKFGLAILIGADTAALGWSFYLGKTIPPPDDRWAWVWFFFTLALTILVIVAEIVSVILTGKTLSTNYKYLAQKYGWKAHLFLTLFFTSLGGLFLHLIVTW